MLKVGDRVTVSFDLAEKCPFLKKAPVTCTGTVKSINDSTVRVYVDAKYGNTEYIGPVDVPKFNVTPKAPK